ncbi:MAG: hypothetical protein Pyrs2KO_34900 [Pyruvatibacter sp.]
MAAVDSVFAALAQDGWRIAPHKAVLGATEVEYLGFVVSGDCVRTSPKKVAALLDMAPPRTLSEPWTFLGMASYYRRFIKAFAKRAAPLHRLLRDDVPFVWTPGAQGAWESLRDALAAEPVMSPPRRDRPFLLHTDWSKQGIAAILSQRDDDGHERVISYAARSLSRAEQR